MCPNFVTCEDQPAHRTVSSAPLFLELNIKHFVGPDPGPNCLLKISFVTASWGGGGGGGGGLVPALLIVLFQPQTKGQGNVHGHVFEIKEADYQTTCCCCF